MREVGPSLNQICFTGQHFGPDGKKSRRIALQIASGVRLPKLMPVWRRDPVSS
jgi:hypothetical protein